MKWKENATLYIGILIPVLMVVFVAGSIYLPRLISGTPPAYDFLYMMGDSYLVEDNMGVEYFVEDEKLQKVEEELPESDLDRPRAPRAPGSPRRDQPSFYLYDVSEDRTKEISFEEASEFRLDSNFESPDGFIVERQGSSFLFDFDFNSGQKRFLRGEHYARELNLNYSNERDFYSFQFLGWIIDN